MLGWRIFFCEQRCCISKRVVEILKPILIIRISLFMVYFMIMIIIPYYTFRKYWVSIYYCEFSSSRMLKKHKENVKFHLLNLLKNLNLLLTITINFFFKFYQTLIFKDKKGLNGVRIENWSSSVVQWISTLMPLCRCHTFKIMQLIAFMETLLS